MDKPHITPLGPDDHRTGWQRGEVTWLLHQLAEIEMYLEDGALHTARDIATCTLAAYKRLDKETP